MLVEFFNKYKTNDGRKAEVISMDGEGSFPVRCKIKDHDGSTFVATYTLEGKRLTGSSSELDLVEQNIRKEKTK